MFLFLDISLLSDLTFTFLWALEHMLGLHSIANDVVGNGCMRPVDRANWRHICPSGVNRVVCMFNGTCKWRHVHIIIITRVRLRRFSSLLLCFLIGCRLGVWCIKSGVTGLYVVFRCLEGSRYFFFLHTSGEHWQYRRVRPERITSHFTDLWVTIPHLRWTHSLT